MLAISFEAAFVRRSTTPDSRIRLPSIRVPTRGVAKGTRVPTTTVTPIGKRIRVRRLTECPPYAIRIRRSAGVVRRRITGGMITGTSAM